MNAIIAVIVLYVALLRVSVTATVTNTIPTSVPMSAPTMVESKLGLSPRGRGKLPPLSQSRPRSRSIPAWAGETYYGIKMAHHRTVYPRVGGGNIV